MSVFRSAPVTVVSVGAALPSLTPESFGAVGDGVVDDGPAFRSLLQAMPTGGNIELAAKTYIIGRSGSSKYCLNVNVSNITFSGIRGSTWIKQAAGMPNASVALVFCEGQSNLTFRGVGFDGNWGNAQTAIASSSSNSALPQSTINVVSTSGFPASGFVCVASDSGPQYLTYSGVTPTSFTGCSGGTGTLMRNGKVGYSDGQFGLNHASRATVATTIGTAGTLPQATVTASATVAGVFPSSGNFVVMTSLGPQVVAYTGTSSNTFTGCTGGVGTMSVGAELYSAIDPQNYLLQLRGCSDVLIDGCDFRQAYGDAIWTGGNSTDATQWARNIRVVNCNIDMTARDGVAIGGSTVGLHIDCCSLTNIYAQAIDGEPVNGPAREVTITNNYLGGWWQLEGHNSAPMSIVGGAQGDAVSANAARGWLVTGNVINGATFIERAAGVVFSANHIVQDWASGGAAAVFLEIGGDAVTIADNYIYSRAVAGGSDGGADIAAIYIYNNATGSTLRTPGDVIVRGNHIHARNGRHGIASLSSGGFVAGTSGTATAISGTSLTDSGASWTVNQWVGFPVRVGPAIASIASNTSTVLTLNAVDSSIATAWCRFSGEYAPTPAVGAYVIDRPCGVVDISENHIDCGDDGYGAGKYGVYTTCGPNDLKGQRVRIRGNKIKNCAADAIHIKWDTASSYYLLDIRDNVAFDDQPTVTTVNAVAFAGTPTYTKLILSGNACADGVTTPVSGLTTGTWLLCDGSPQAWTGYGSPAGVVVAPIGSLYQRIDGGTTTTLYVKESGNGASTGWVAK